jgi:hypothetical protein
MIAAGDAVRDNVGAGGVGGASTGVGAAVTGGGAGGWRLPPQPDSLTDIPPINRTIRTGRQVGFLIGKASLSSWIGHQRRAKVSLKPVLHHCPVL